MNNISERQRLLIFAAIGIFNTAVDITIFLFLRHLTVPIIIANIVSTSIALGGSYVLNKRFAFQANGDAKRSLPLFLAVTLIGLWVLQPIVIKLVLLFLHISSVNALAINLINNPGRFYELLAKLTATPVTLVWNYVLYKRVVFKDRAQQPPQ